MTDLFVFYRSFWDAIKEMDDTEQLKMFHALCRYALDETVPNFDSPIQRAVFAVMKPVIDANVTSRETGKRGGRPRKPPFQKSETGVLENENGGFENENPPFQKSETNKKQEARNKKQETRNKHQEQEARSEHYSAAENPPPAPASSSKKKFIPPTLDEVAAYCNERHNGISPSMFIDYYEARGWKYGTSKPMVNWKAAVRTWEQKEKGRTHTQDKQQNKATEEVNARIFEELFGGEPT